MTPFAETGALFWDRRRPRLLSWSKGYLVATRALSEVKPATRDVFELSNPLVTPFELTDALFWDRRRPRLLAALQACPERQQARTPAVPEERARFSDGDY